MTLPCVFELTAGGKKPPAGLRQLFELTNKGARRIELRASSQNGLQDLSDLIGAAAGGTAVLPAAPVSFTRSRRQKPASTSNIQGSLTISACARVLGGNSKRSFDCALVA
jgi:hypothetical protein